MRHGPSAALHAFLLRCLSVKRTRILERISSGAALRNAALRLEVSKGERRHWDLGRFSLAGNTRTRLRSVSTAPMFPSDCISGDRQESSTCLRGPQSRWIAIGVPSAGIRTRCGYEAGTSRIRPAPPHHRVSTHPSLGVSSQARHGAIQPARTAPTRSGKSRAVGVQASLSTPGRREAN